MPQIHLRAEPGDYAPLVLLPGDPNRATRIAAMFDGGLERTRKVNDHRALYGYTGTYQGVPVSVQTTGMGTPSFSIVVEELLRLGATRLIRVGHLRRHRPGHPHRGPGRGHGRGPHRRLDAHLPPRRPVRAGRRLRPDARAGRRGDGRRRAPFVGPIATVDVFYNPDADYVSKWRGRGILGFEMEAAALFYLAGREQGSGKDVRAACALTVSRHALGGGDLRGHLHEPRGPRAGDRHDDPGRARGRLGVPRDDGRGRARIGSRHPGRRQPDEHPGHRALVAGHRRSGSRPPASRRPGSGTTS